ncbi:MAG: DNA polymerase III subunit epsilon [Gammaproteobacteria bacterium]|nr:DNA polymerase III subunit epsilon [Gammaproteobacteria bacterium]NNC56834.1 DNA polymerase III subunit epsilon [Woeseiaceae bacterium]
MRQVVLDTETTGLSVGHGHRIIEIGCLELVDRRLTGREFHRFLNPDRDIDEGAEAVHGISRADLENEPRFPEIVDDLLEFLKGAELVIHNATFDIGFIEHELRLMKHPQPKMQKHATVLDTLTLARKIHPGQRNTLDALCKRYAVDATKRDVHGALIDSELLANVYLAMTGGQTALLLDEDSSRRETGAAGGDKSRTGRALRDSVASDLELVVIKASQEEEAAHEALLKKIRKSGACVWDFD